MKWPCSRGVLKNKIVLGVGVKNCKFLSEGFSRKGVQGGKVFGKMSTGVKLSKYTVRGGKMDEKSCPRG